MKVAIAALLLTFSTFWFGEELLPLVGIQLSTLNDLFLIPLFVVYVLIVYLVANRETSALIEPNISSIEH